MPSRCASTIPWLTSGVKPKSSALTTSCFRAIKTPSKQRQPDGEEFLGICPHIFRQALELARRASQRFVQLRVHQELAERPLAGVDLVDRAVELRHQIV